MPTIHYAASDTISIDSNEWAAIIQVVASTRFREGKGFWLTIIASASEVQEPKKVTWWLSPNIPLRVEYDSDQPVVQLTQESLDTWLRIADSDFGMIIGDVDQLPFVLPAVGQSSTD